MGSNSTSPHPTPSLFPTFPLRQANDAQGSLARPGDSGRPASPRSGIANLAASSTRAETKRGTEYFLLPVRSILNRCDSARVPFAWTVNPYRGCEFGCRYCYARYTHEYMELDGAEFERKIYIKQRAGELVGLELDRKLGNLAPASGPASEHIAMGTATDPYQPAELEFGVTRSILEQMSERSGLSVSITTKSNQVLRDLELLQRIAARSALHVNITVTTLRLRLARLLEPRAPRPDLRLAAVRALRQADVTVGVFAMPVLPGLTDREADLDALARAARDAGAQWFAANVLFLMPSAQKQFMPFLEQKFPRLARQYRNWYARSGYAPETYRYQIAALVRRLREKYGLAAGPAETGGLSWHSPQLALALDSTPPGAREAAAVRIAPPHLPLSSLSRGRSSPAGRPSPCAVRG